MRFFSTIEDTLNDILAPLHKTKERLQDFIATQNEAINRKKEDAERVLQEIANHSAQIDTATNVHSNLQTFLNTKL
jgi:predicted  nucleic acid-binding Zn-ribbon protein